MKAYVASHLKDMNRRNVYKLIKGMESTSKAEISKLTGISAPTVIKIVNFLLQKNLILEIGEGETALGRKPHLLTLNEELMYVAAFVLEGDFLYAGIVDIRGKVIYKLSMYVQQDIRFIMDEIKDRLLEKLFEKANIPIEKLCGIGIALPGIYTVEDKKIESPLVVLDEPLCIEKEIDELTQKFGVKVYIENDTNAQAIGEFDYLRMESDQDLIFISLGTGLGAGIILGGKLRRGARSMCGEIGYISYDEQYRSDKKNWGWLEANIGYRRLEQKFGFDNKAENVEIAENQKQEIIDFVAPFLAKCINNISVFLDCANVSLGGKMVELLGKPLIDRVNSYLSYLCITGTEVRMQSTVDVGLIGIATAVTNDKITKMLMEEDV